MDTIPALGRKRSRVMEIRLISRRLAFAFFLVFGATCLAKEVLRGADQPTMLAETPPMGWNSWDGYGTTINEAEFRANADRFATHLKPYGWQDVVVHAEWYVTNLVAEGNSKPRQDTMDRAGAYMPPTRRFPPA